MPRSTYRLSVPQELYDSVCEAVDQDFADAYLFGAMLIARKLTPRTLTGWHKMRDRHEFVALLKKLGLELVRPAPWKADGSRPSHRDCYG